MSTTTLILDQPKHFSLVEGGPVFQLLLRAGLVKHAPDLVVRRILVISLAAWLPLLFLSAASGRLVNGTSVPFLVDVGAQVRFLVCIPLLVAAEVIVHLRLKVILQQFLDRAIISPEDCPSFESCIASAMRLRNSVAAEMLVLGLAVAFGQWAGKRYVETQVATWFSIPVAGESHLTLAGYWYVFVSLTILRFLMLRWLFRVLIWYRLLWQISRRVPLQLNAMHPDRAGGLGFLSNSAYALEPIVVAMTAGISGILGGKIWHESARLPQFKVEIAAWVVLLTMLVLTPLLFFITHLAAAKRNGTRELGIIASRYVGDFRRKWIQGPAPGGETLLGTGDIQSLADLANSFEIVRGMRLVPFDRATIFRLVVAAVLPFAPLVLTMIPLEQLIDRAVGIFV